MIKPTPNETMVKPPPRHLLTFDDLPLQEAVRVLFEDPEFVKSEALLNADEGREWILQKVIANLPREYVGQYRFETILLAATR